MYVINLTYVKNEGNVTKGWKEETEKGHEFVIQRP